MAEAAAAPAPAPTAADAQPVKAFDRLGNKIELPASDVPELVKLGGRVASPQELAEHKAEQDYEAKSAAEKVTGVLRYSSPAVFAASLAATGETPTLPPKLESYAQGVGDTFGGGLPQLAVKEAARLAGGDQAARAYVQRADTAVTANPTANTLGQAVGFGASLVAGGASPVGLAGKAGGAVETAAAKALSGVAERGVLGQAVATGGKLAARGALEGAMLSGTTYASGAAFHDEPITGVKLFSALGHGAMLGGGLGATLGFSGSLVASGAQAAKRAAGAQISRLVSEAEAGATSTAKLMPGSGQVEKAAGKAASNLAVDALGATQAQQNKVFAKLGNISREEMGEWLAQKVPALARQEGETVSQAAWRAFKGGRADDLLEQITPLRQAAGAKIGEVLKANPATIEASELLGKANAIYSEMVADPLRAAGAKAFSDRIFTTFKALEEKAAREGVPFGKLDAADTYYLRSGMEKQAIDVGKSPANDALKQWLREVDDVVVSRVDEAAKAAGNKTARAEIEAAKKEFRLAISAEKLADQGSKRVAGNNIFGLREGVGMAVGLATGSAVGGVVAGVGGKLLRERGAAVGAALLNAAVDRGAVAKTLELVDRTIERSAAGVLREPAKLPQRASGKVAALPRAAAVAGSKPQPQQKAAANDVRRQADAVVKWAGEIRANPQAAMQRIQAASADVSRTAGPNAAAAFTQAQMKALAYVSGQIPTKERRDPLDPRSTPPLTTEESERVVRAAKYAAQPMTVWKDFERGKVTPEGIAAAEAFMPEQLQAFRQQLLAHVTDHMGRNQRLTATQRLRIDQLLGGVAISPESVASLQANFAPVAPDQQSPAPPAPTGAKKVDMQVQQTGFDAVEARKS